MKLSNFYKIRPSLINNNPLCKNCKFYIRNNQLCGKFGNTDLVRGYPKYESASNVRYAENKCGEKGKYFQKNNYKFITVPYYILEEYSIFFLPPIIITSSVLLYSYFLLS
jgi:hypothetical protein